MRLNLRAQFLEVLNNGVVDSTPQVCMLIGNDAGLVADVVVDVLQTAFAQELVSGTEGDLDNTCELSKLLGGVGLDVGDALEQKLDNVQESPSKTHLEVGCELLNDRLPCNKALD